MLTTTRALAMIDPHIFVRPPGHGGLGRENFAKRAAVAVALLLAIANPLSAQNIRLPTLGGTQFWTDHFIYHGWRIQQNAVTDHYRLLNDKNVHQTRGTFQHCRERFDQLKREKELPAPQETAIVTVHGLGRTRGAMKGLAQYLTENGDWTSINVTYASTRKTVADHARALGHILDHLEGVNQVHLVGHSLGCIVIRHHLADRDRDPNGRGRGPSIGRVVMLAPPSNGSSAARILKKSKLFAWIGGASGRQLGAAWEELKPRLATPKDFGVIAGSTRNGKGSNPLIPGDDDLIVGVEETKLAGASDFLLVPSMHTYIMDKEKVKEATLRFLERGYFVSAAHRNPIVAAP